MIHALRCTPNTIQTVTGCITFRSPLRWSRVRSLQFYAAAHCSAGPIFKVIFNICCVREVQGVCIGTYCTIIVSIFFTATNPASECGHVTQGCMLGRAEKELLRRFHNHGEGPYIYKDLLCQPNLVVPYYL